MVKYDLQRHNLRYERFPEKWIDGIFLGNGEIGAMVWGNGSPLKISLDKMDYWENRMDPKGQFGPDHNWEDMQRLIAAKDYQGLIKKYELYMGSSKDKAWLLQPTRLPMPRLEILFSKGFQSWNVELDIYNAQIIGSIIIQEISFDVKIYIHANINLMHFEIKKTPNQENSANIEQITQEIFSQIFVDVDIKHWDTIAHANLKAWGYPAPIKEKMMLNSRNSMSYYYQEQPENQGGLLISWVEHKFQDRLTLDLQILNQANLLPCEKPQPLKETLINISKDRFERLEDGGLEKYWVDHLEFWHNYWEKAMISIPDSILENLYYIELYKLGCNSRWGKYPVTLQGIWTLDGGMPPWAGDYHLDMNVEESYWPIYVNNRLDAGEPLFRWLSESIPKFRENCKRFYGCDGILPGCAITLQGDNLHGYYNTEIWPGNGAWAAHMFWLYWLYSKDKCFLTHKAFPFMEGVMALYEHLLVKAEYGEYHIPLSCSPEFHEHQLSAWGKNPTCDIALVRWLVEALLETVKILKLEQNENWLPRISKWKDISENLTFYPVDYSGFQVLENRPYDIPHRHMTHLFPIHPFHQVTIEGDRDDLELIKSSFKTLRRVGNWEWTGWTLPWLSMMAEWTGNPWLGYKWARDYLLFIKENTMHVNGDPNDQGICVHVYEPMTLEAGFCFAAAIPEMLMQSWGGIIRVFEHMPKMWHDAKFIDLRAEGGFLVSAELNAGNLCWMRILSENRNICKIKNTFTTPLCLIQNRSTEIVELNEEKSIIEIEMEKDDEIWIVPGNLKSIFPQNLLQHSEKIKAQIQTEIPAVDSLFCGEKWFGAPKLRKNPYLP
jgi:alpha-L-fucosidase 2